MNRHRELTGWLGWVMVVASVLTILLALDNVRAFGAPLFEGLIQLETQYYYGLITLLLPMAFLVYKPSVRFSWLPLDILLAITAAGVFGWLYVSAETILDEGWEFGAPETAVWISLAAWLLVMEGVRRTAGMSLFVLVLVFSFYPMIADQMPAMISGMSTSLGDTAAYHVMSSESIIGLPFRAFAGLVIGFLVFGIALQHTGGGDFFIRLAFGILGGVRGGPAKVAILASGLMGSMSGSVITNVLTTGQLTIPAMKRSGISREVSAGIEACASTGGVLLPPIMGSTAFVMATFLEIPYYQVALAAALPALLYFLALFIQIDAYAARNDLKGLPAEDIPGVIDTLRSGWYYMGAFIVLTVLLLVLQRETLAPWIATLCLLILNQFSAEHRWQFSDLLTFIRSCGALMTELLVILAGVGLIVGALSMTGLSGTLVNELLFLAGGSTGILLLMGAATSFVLGIGMTVTAAYIFLAIVLAPALVQGGLNPLSVHLFILYWGMLSFITPPVALGAFAAASIADAHPMRTGIAAMGLGACTYFIPFFFVLEPSLILNGPGSDSVRHLVEACAGIFLIAGGIQGYMPWPGKLAGADLLRPCLLVGGLLIALPGLESLDIALSNNDALLLGLAIILLGLALHGFRSWRLSASLS
ncbi:MAG: TRAP transporter fused permease subunit [Pseudomonadales bacterium]|nr:TRAP transporter fused permease subunit [Pseudomonadales bacterium]